MLSKLYFRPEHLLLALDDQDLSVGFVHFGETMRGTPWENDTTADPNSAVGSVHALCVVPHEDEWRLAHQLISHAVGVMRQAGVVRCRAIGSLASSIFYHGIADGDNLMGVLETDTRTASWLEHSGFHSTTQMQGWDLSLDAFRPPVDRRQIAIRRTCSISRILEESHPNWWISTVLGHCDQSRFHLLAHGPERSEMEVLYWSPDTTIRGVDSSVARLCLPHVALDETDRERLICLIAESARQLQQERKRTIRAVIAQGNTSLQIVLSRLGFRSNRGGRLMELANGQALGAVPSVG